MAPKTQAGFTFFSANRTSMICHLEYWRKKRGFTQKGLAAYLKTYGINADASYISRLETMTIPNPSIHTVLILADALGCLAEDLYSL